MSRCPRPVKRVEDRIGVGGSGSGWQLGVGDLRPDGSDFSNDVADGAPAHVTQFGEGALRAWLALIPGGGHDWFVAGDPQGEDTSRGTGEVFSAAPSVAVPLAACVQNRADPFDQCDQVGAGHPGQFGGGKKVRCLGPGRDGLAA